MKRSVAKFIASGVIPAAMLIAFVGAAFAQAFPSQPINLIVPWPPGGGSDIAMRLVADSATRKFGAPVVVVNKPGAGGTIGLKEVTLSKPDGYTVGMLATGAIFSQYNNPSANAMSDFEVIAFFGDDPALISASAKTGFKTLADFINFAKANPGKIKNGNDQPGGSSYITAALMEKKLGVRLIKVPYAGFAPTVQALLSGEIDTVTVPAPDIAQHHKSGAARILGVASNKRHFLAPDVPTFREQGVDFIAGAWRAIAGPKSIPPERLAVLEAKFLEALRDQDFQDKAKTAGFIVEPMGRADTARRLVQEDNDMYPVFLEAGLVKTRQK